jgi:release factor glutamine methyltransferase
LSAAERFAFRELVRRRALREPVSLIVGRKEFWSIPFKVIQGVLIPRPDTEVLVQGVLDEIAQTPSPFILEIGVGSGAPSLAVASERKDAFIAASDISTAALMLAKENRDALCAWSVQLMGADLFAPFREGPIFDCIFSNPPYVRDDVIAGLEPEIEYEPLTALSGGADGMGIIRNLVPHARLRLKPGGSLLIEIGENQRDQVTRLFEMNGFIDIAVVRDYAGKPRVVKGRVPKCDT